MLAGCMVSVLMLNTLRSAQHSLSGGMAVCENIRKAEVSAVYWPIGRLCHANIVTSAYPAGEFGLFDGDASTVFYEVHLWLEQCQFC